MAGTEPGPARGETTHRLAFAPGGADQAALMRSVLATAPARETWRVGRVDDAGPQVVAGIITVGDTEPTEGVDWLLGAVADYEMRVRIVLQLIAEDNRGPDDEEYLAELSRRGWAHLDWTGPPGEEIQVAHVTDTGRLVL